MYRQSKIIMAILVALFTAAPLSAQLAAPNSAGVSWGHIHLNVTDVEAHTRIWTEHFGGRVVDLEIFRTISLPNTIIMLNDRAPTGGTAGSSLNHFGFSVPDVATFLARWRAAGLEVESEFEGPGGLPQAFLLLPDGIRVELDQVPSLDVPAIPYHVHIYTGGDPSELRDWFAERFSMESRERGNNPFTADVPGMNVSFTASEEQPAPNRGRAVDHIGFEIEGLENFVQKLIAMGVVFDVEVEYRVVEGRTVGVAFFTDASGTFWELTEGLDDLAGS